MKLDILQQLYRLYKFHRQKSLQLKQKLNDELKKLEYLHYDEKLAFRVHYDVEHDSVVFEYLIRVTPESCTEYISYKIPRKDIKKLIKTLQKYLDLE